MNDVADPMAECPPQETQNQSPQQAAPTGVNEPGSSSEPHDGFQVVSAEENCTLKRTREQVDVTPTDNAGRNYGSCSNDAERQDDTDEAAGFGEDNQLLEAPIQEGSDPSSSAAAAAAVHPPAAKRQKSCDSMDDSTADAAAAAAAKKVNNENWDAMFQRLVAYREKFGDCLVPKRYAEDAKLGTWVETQRVQYKKLERAVDEASGVETVAPNKRLNQERLERLQSIGFAWSKYY